MTEYLQCLNLFCMMKPAVIATTPRHIPTTALNIHKCPYCHGPMYTPNTKDQYWGFITSVCRAFTPSQLEWLTMHQQTKAKVFADTLIEARLQPSKETIDIWITELIKITNKRTWPLI